MSTHDVAIIHSTWLAFAVFSHVSRNSHRHDLTN